MGGDEDHRRFAAGEIVSSERSYVRDLRALVQAFLVPLRSHSSQETGCSPGDVQAIFSNLEAIVAFNEQLLEALEEEAAGKAGASSIGQIFVDMGPYLSIYTSFINNTSTATETHLRLLETGRKNKDGLTQYAVFLQECAQSHAEEVRGRQLMDLLIMPVQRVPRYRLLLEELLKRTSPSDPEYEVLESGLARIADVANTINERLRDFENRQRVVQVQMQFHDPLPSLVVPHRVFVKEGNLSKMCRRGPRVYRFVLFNDLLIYGAGSLLDSVAASQDSLSYKLKRRVELSSAKVADVSDTSFEVKSPEKSFLIISDDPAVKSEWYTALEQCIRAIQLDRALTDTVANGVAPVWVPDSAAPTCHTCNAKFGLLLRRHHCRNCGSVVCDRCSPHRWILPNLSNKPQRICDDCYLSIRAKLEETGFESAGSAELPRPAAPMRPPPASSSAAAAGGGGGSGAGSAAPGLFSKWMGQKQVVAASAATANASSTATAGGNNATTTSSTNKAASSRSTTDPKGEPLPKNWVALKDEAGVTYYWHLITDKVQYERPTGRIQANAAFTTTTTTTASSSSTTTSSGASGSGRFSSPVVTSTSKHVHKSAPAPASPMPVPVNKATPVSSATSAALSPVVTNAARRSLVRQNSANAGPSLAERLALLAESGKLGDAAKARIPAANRRQGVGSGRFTSPVVTSSHSSSTSTKPAPTHHTSSSSTLSSSSPMHGSTTSSVTAAAAGVRSASSTATEDLRDLIRHNAAASNKSSRFGSDGAPVVSQLSRGGSGRGLASGSSWIREPEASSPPTVAASSTAGKRLSGGGGLSKTPGGALMSSPMKVSSSAFDTPPMVTSLSKGASSGSGARPQSGSTNSASGAVNGSSRQSKSKADMLSPEEFKRLTGKSREDFAKMPAWQQVEEKARLKIL